MLGVILLLVPVSKLQVIVFVDIISEDCSSPYAKRAVLQKVACQRCSAEHAEAMQSVLHAGTFFAELGVMENAQDALKQLSQDFDIFITTAAMEYPASCGPKFQWLQKNFPFISPLNIVFCGHKNILAADYLVDDNVRHFHDFQGQGVLFSAPHNQKVKWSPRVSNWRETVSYLTAQRLAKNP